jgi:hypothetical protein
MDIMTNESEPRSHKDHGALDDTQLDAVTGGMLYLQASPKSSSSETFRDHVSPSQTYVLVAA